MELIIEDPAPPVGEARLAEFERRSGRRLPPAYRSFLLAHNGGRPRQPCDFTMSGPGGMITTGTVDRFLGVGAPEHFDLERYLAVYAGRVPARMLPIAYDPGGNLICLSTGGGDEGAVYFWDHEFEADDGRPPTEENLYPLAGDLATFLNRLCAAR